MTPLPGVAPHPNPPHNPPGLTQSTVSPERVSLHAMSADLLGLIEHGTYQPSTPASGPAAPAAQRYSFFDDLTCVDKDVRASTEQNPVILNTIELKPATNLPQSSIRTRRRLAENQSNEDWGDFETASATVTGPVATATTCHANTWSDAALSWPSVPGRSSAQQRPLNDLLLDSLSSAAETTHTHRSSNTSDGFSVDKYKTAAERNPNILLDTKEEIRKRVHNKEDDDDFGDFEVGEATIRGTAQPADLLSVSHIPRGMGLTDPSSDLPGVAELRRTIKKDSRAESALEPGTEPPANVRSTQRPTQRNQMKTSLKPISQWKLPPARSQVQRTSPRSERPNNLLALMKDKEAWDDFVESNAPAHYVDNVEPSDGHNASSLDQRVRAEPSPDELPPTNIPPPSTILSLFPPLLSSAQEKLFHPLSSQPHNLKNRVFSDPSSIEFLRGYLALATVVARVIAGRKLRWKRDTHLSQSMKISAAPASGRSSGMKLAGLDKAEAAKEDGEVVDVVRVWKEQVGKLRSAVATAQGVESGTVPDIQETMAVRAAKEMEGAVLSRKPCGLCGLRREERLVKGEGEVLDAFGEWWIERVGMHRTCWNLWTEHRSELTQR